MHASSAEYLAPLPEAFFKLTEGMRVMHPKKGQGHPHTAVRVHMHVDLTIDAGTVIKALREITQDGATVRLEAHSFIVLTCVHRVVCNSKVYFWRAQFCARALCAVGCVQTEIKFDTGKLKRYEIGKLTGRNAKIRGMPMHA